MSAGMRATGTLEFESEANSNAANKASADLGTATVQQARQCIGGFPGIGEKVIVRAGRGVINKSGQTMRVRISTLTNNPL